VTELDPDRVLALSYVPAKRRSAIAALWALDAALGAVLAGGREPMISRIKLAWWRDSLDRLDGARPPGELLLQALAEHVLPLGIRGAELAAMEEGWAVLLSDAALGPADLSLYAEKRGRALFSLSARLLSGTRGEAGFAGGEAWALIDLARHCGNATDADSAIEAARRVPPVEVPPRLRPLGMLDALARRDCDPRRPRWEIQGSPGRMWRMLRYRLTGK
jgi:15-cis-phytoene synthase